MKINEIIYYCLDAIKAVSDDSHVNEEHVLFLLSKYRSTLLQQQSNQSKVNTDTNFQTIDIDLNTTIMPYNINKELKSVKPIPTIMPIAKPQILMFNGFENEAMEFVPFKRIKAVGWNKWKSKFLYTAIGPDSHIYVVYNNPFGKYLKKIRFKAIFEDFIKVFDYQYGVDAYDIMEQEFPLEYSLVPGLIAMVVKDILGTAWRMADNKNDANDDLADIANYVRLNMKKRYNNIIEGEDEE